MECSGLMVQGTATWAVTASVAGLEVRLTTHRTLYNPPNPVPTRLSSPSGAHLFDVSPGHMLHAPQQPSVPQQTASEGHSAFFWTPGAPVWSTDHSGFERPLISPEGAFGGGGGTNTNLCAKVKCQRKGGVHL